MKYSFLVLTLLSTGTAHPTPPALERIEVSADGRGFVQQPSGHAFHPWGVNYGNAGRLMEDFWDKEPNTLAADFHKIAGLGANVVRLHLQFNKFMVSYRKPDADALEKLGRLVALAEATGLYLDLTGLACYRTADVPPWYDAMDERARWAAQCVFWHAIAETCRKSNAIFCYDLMNEPMAPSGPDGKWYSGSTLGGYDFLQAISRELGDRKRGEVAVTWIDTLSAAIREKDKQHLITVGMLPWVKGWGHLFGFVPMEVAPHLDFLSIHLYPDSKKPDEVRKALSECAGHGKPVVIEETFPLSCSTGELETFLKESRTTACGWIWHYDGFTPLDYLERAKGGKNGGTDAVWQEALQLFVKMKPEMMADR